jgi:CRISPR/Cas system CSM-associated protein Csm3 (group 7 of RAMP superfamily)
MTNYWLRIDLLSDTTFGNGDGVAGFIDVEVQHDEFGLPYLGGRTLKGMLSAASAEILFALQLAGAPRLATWQQCAQLLFGAPGSGDEQAGNMHVGNAQLPGDLRALLREQFLQPGNDLKRENILSSLTSIRRQTAMEPESGAPKENTLRTIRVILHDTPFAARCDLLDQGELAEEDILTYLAVCLKAFRRAGSERNRGKGRIVVDLYSSDPFEDSSQPITETYFKRFAEELVSA